MKEIAFIKISQAILFKISNNKSLNPPIHSPPVTSFMGYLILPYVQSSGGSAEESLIGEQVKVFTLMLIYSYSSSVTHRLQNDFCTV